MVEHREAMVMQGTLRGRSIEIVQLETLVGVACSCGSRSHHLAFWG